MGSLARLLAARLAGEGRQANGHPEADVLTAFAEKRLGRRERAEVLRHLANCGECRDVVALVTGCVEEKRAAATGGASWRRWSWAAGLAAAAMLGFVFWKPTVERPTPKLQEPAAAVQSAKLETPREPPRQALPKVRPKVQREPARRAVVALSQPPVASVLPQTVVVEGMPKTDHVTAVKIGGMSFLEGAPPQAAGASTLRAPAASAAQGVFANAFVRPRQQASLWSVDESAGRLQKSEDGGKTWIPIMMAGRGHFLALASSGRELWVGGKDGLLLHSTDDGGHWSEVPVMDGEERIKDWILGIETETTPAVKVRTKSAEFMSADGGVSWVKR